jgi:hypothetical protein
MSQCHDGEPREAPEPDAELEQARELLARTVRFLALCAEDPEAALAEEDPHDLIRGLESLRNGPGPRILRDPAEEPRTIPLRRRRSA